VITPGGDEVRKVFTDALNVPAEQLSKVPLGRFGQPRDIAEMVAFLASDRTEWITGQNYFVNGGAS
jgi:NAD(P)-dependent dehydrogenase (short-subunit alcohol dehydrogenase family)